MSQVVQADGSIVPVTVLTAGPCTITQIKSKEKDGYQAVQLGFGSVKKVPQPKQGHLKPSGGLFNQLREVPAESLEGLSVGQTLGPDIFAAGELVNVVGITKGRGYQGGVKRHGFKGGPKTHGQSDRLRAPGSVGAGTRPGRVWKGKKMAGHMGSDRVTIKNLEVVQVDQEKNILILKGGVPGSPKDILMVYRTGKKTARPAAPRGQAAAKGQAKTATPKGEAAKPQAKPAAKS
jgi:large subunit ribosomal protein L3